MSEFPDSTIVIDGSTGVHNREITDHCPRLHNGSRVNLSAATDHRRVRNPRR